MMFCKIPRKRFSPKVACILFFDINLCFFSSLSFCSGESEPGDGQCVGGGGGDGDHQLSGEEQRRLGYPAAQPQQTDDLLQRHET